MINWDRFPALPMWPRKGNFDNVMVTQQGSECTLVFIDQAVMLLTEARDRLEYFHALRGFVEEVASACDGAAGIGGDAGGMQRLRNAVRSQVPLWTGDKAKDAEIYERFMVKPDSVPGVELEDDTCGFLLEGLSEVFSRARALRMEFAKKRVQLSARCRELFADTGVQWQGHDFGHHKVDAEQWAKLSARIEACLDFVYACLGVVESEDICKGLVSGYHAGL